MPHQCTNCGHVFEDGSKEMLSGCPDCGGNKFQYHPGEVPDEQPSTDAEPPEREGGTVSGAVGRAANKVRDAVTSDPEGVTGTGNGAETSTTASDDTADEATASPDGSTATDTPDSSTATGSPDSSAAASSSDSSAATDSPRSSSTGTGPKPEDGEQTTTEPESAAAPETKGDASGSGVDADVPDSEDTAQADARSEVVDPNSLPDAPAEAPTDGRVVKEPDDPDDRPDLEELRSELNDQFESIRIVAPGQYELNLMELYDRQEYIIALQEDGQYVIEVPDAWETDDE